MKRCFVAATFVALFAVAFGFAANTSAQVPMVGSFKAIAVDNEEVLYAAQFAIDAFNQKEETTLELDSVFSAQYQVVAGMNYRLGIITFFPDPDGNPVFHCVQVQVYRDLKKNYTLKSWADADCPEMQ